MSLSALRLKNLLPWSTACLIVVASTAPLSAAEPAAAPASGPETAPDHRVTRRERARLAAEQEDATLRQTVKDLRFAVGAEQGPRRVSYDGAAGGQTYVVSRDPELVGSLTFVYGRLRGAGGCIIGTGVSAGRGEFAAPGPNGVMTKITYERYVGLFKVGYGYAFDHAVHLEILPYVGGGFGSASVRGFSGVNGSQVAGVLGVDAGLYVRVDHMRFGITAGYGGASAIGDHVNLHGQGAQAGLVYGVAF